MFVLFCFQAEKDALKEKINKCTAWELLNPRGGAAENLISMRAPPLFKPVWYGAANYHWNAANLSHPNAPRFTKNVKKRRKTPN